MDDIESMTEQALLDTIRTGLLRDLARALRSGTATHQEKAIAKALLRDNASKVRPDEPDGEDEFQDDETEVDPRIPPARRPVKDYGDSKG